MEIGVDENGKLVYLPVPVPWDPVKEIKTNFFYAVDGYRDLELNDEYLIKLILDYPVMYDCTRYFYKDKYLRPYAWAFINEKFNQKYNELGLDGLFMPISLELRWEQLIPLIKEVSQEPHFSRLSNPLNEYVYILATHFANVSNAEPKQIGQVQPYLTANIEYVKQLPPVVQKNIELDVVKRICDYENEHYGIVKSKEHCDEIQADVAMVLTLMQGEW